MKQHYIRYMEKRQAGPLSCWVHKRMGSEPWYAAGAYDPPLPKVVPGKGYPYYFVEFDNFTFEFASLDELDACVATLSQKNLPDTTQETEAGKTGPGSHWLNKLPGKTKSWHFREKAIKYLQEAREDSSERSPRSKE